MTKFDSSIRALSLGILALYVGGCATTETTTQPPTETQEARPMPAPAPEMPAERPAPPPAPMGSPTYNVVRGDHLWGIASKPSIYGNPYQWPLIYKTNSDKIKDADLIYPGQVFTIDKDPSSSDVDAAVQHAKTRGAWSLGVVEDSDKRYLSR